ncbi:MAG: TlpA family protein disulfide reductase [Vicinamibacteria bacterium]
MTLIATALTSLPVRSAQPSDWSGGATPPLVLRDLDGREVRLDAYRGRTVIVNFWATWCAPCVEEMPSLMRLRDKFASRGLEVIAVNFQENAARIKPFMQRYGLEMPVVRDHDGSARTSWGVNVFPSSFVIGPDQKVAFVVVGEADWSGPPIEPRIRSILFP